MAHYEPDSATGRMKAARRHRERAYAERNELIGVLTRLWPSHVMPVSANLSSLADGRAVICIHSPAGQLAWILSVEEADETFPALPRITENHWDRSTRTERSARLSMLRKDMRSVKPSPSVETTLRQSLKRKR